jgi:outer membrane receptor protein involved in Fe transport
MNEGGTFARVPQLSSNYGNTTKVFAAYGSFSNKINKFGYQLGLRLENSEYSGTVNTASLTGKDTVITYGNNFPLSLFPSIFLTQELGNKQELQFNVTRRINRPDFWELFPFTDYADSLNLRRGNPDLRPEFTYSAEISYQKTYSGKNTFLASAYFKYIDQLITRFQEKEINPVTGRDILINTFINANSSYIGGLELISRQSVFSWWEVVSNLNLYTSKINTGNAAIIQQGNIFSWFGKVNNTFKLPANFSIQISGEYRSKSVLSTGGGGGGGSTAQGYRRPQGEVDAGIRFEFLKEKKASITLNISDVFRTDANNAYSESLYFTQNSYRLRDPQFFRLNFSWRFGKFDTSLFRRRNNKDQEEAPEENADLR